MARKKINVSAAIKEYLGQHSDVGPTEAAAAISKQIGKKVTPIYVSNIKTQMNATSKKKGRRGRKPGRKPGSAVVTARAHSNGSVQLSTIKAMKTIVGQVGADTARQLIDLLA
jgi:hypothetical protein